MNQKEKLSYILQNTFNHDEFKPYQYEPIECLTQDQPCDVLCVFPTSAGKSLIYQLPTIYNNKITIVISPLLSLMQDQINKLKSLKLNAFSYSSDDSMNSKLDLVNVANSGSQEIHYIFTTPEQLINQQFKALVTKLQNKIGLVCIDECHVIVEWGKSFRRSYRNLNIIRDELLPHSIPICALTASTTYNSAQQIISQLKLQKQRVFIQSFNRKNIFYSVYHKQGQMKKEQILYKILNKYYLSKENQQKSVIIYTSTRQEAENLEQLLNAQDFQCFFYHAGLSNDQKTVLLRQWTNDQIKVIIATIAFAMGIDKASVGLVVHFCLPKSMEGFYQESGRAGRNGEDSYSVVLVDSADVNFRTSNIQKEDKYDQLSYYYLLKLLYDNACRRKILLQYFNSGIEHSKQKHCCDFCNRSHLFSDVYGFQNEMFSGLVDGVDSQIRNLESHCIRRKLTDLQSLPMEYDREQNTTAQSNPDEERMQNKNSTDQPKEKSTLEKARHDVKKEIILACKRKMGEYVVDQLTQKVDALVKTIIMKSKSNPDEICKCGQHVVAYINRQQGAFSYGSLQIQVNMFFM